MFIQGIRLLGNGLVVDSQEASSLSHERQNIQVYSNSWGPSDDSITVAGPGDLVQQAFFEGISEVNNYHIISVCQYRCFIRRYNYVVTQ